LDEEKASKPSNPALATGLDHTTPTHIHAVPYADRVNVVAYDFLEATGVRDPYEREYT